MRAYSSAVEQPAHNRSVLGSIPSGPTIIYENECKADFCFAFFAYEENDGGFFMKLGARLKALADFVPVGSKTADIGTDHAYLPIFLLENQIASKVIACDVNEGPCQMAKKAIEAANLERQIDLRLGNGLMPLAVGEVDVVTIAGMGGGLMQELLQQSLAVVDSLHGLVLQPMNASAQLRQWLYGHQWHIEAETLVVEDGRLYEVIYALPGEESLPEPVLLAIGPKLWQEKPILLQQHIKNLWQQEKRVLDGMKQSERAQKSDKFQETLAKIEELEARMR